MAPRDFASFQEDFPIMSSSHHCVSGFVNALVASLLLAPMSASLAHAQTRGSGGGSAPQKKPAEPPKGAEPTRGGAKETGKVKGWIKGFTPAAGTEEEDLIGTLKFQPEEKGGKVMTLRVHRRDTVEFKFGTEKLDFERFQEFVWPGLYCTAAWGLEPTGDAKKKPTQKELKGLVLEIVEVRGTLQEITDDSVTVKGCKPLKGDWPDVEPSKGSSAGSSPSGKSAIKPRDLKIKTFEKLSAFLNREGKAGDPGEYQVGDPVEVWMAFGKSKAFGIMASVRKAKAEEPGSKSEPGRPRQPTLPKPGGGGRKPGG